MDYVDEKSRKVIFLFWRVALVVLFFFVGLIFGGFFGVIFKSSMFFWGAWVGFSIFGFWLGGKVAQYHIKKAVRKIEKISELILSRAIGPAYFLSGTTNGVAVDVKNNKVIAYDEVLGGQEPLVFCGKEIRSIEAIKPGLITYEISGPASTGDIVSVGVKNINNALDANTKTGLCLRINNINTPNVFVQMAYEQAERWVVLIEKMLEESVEPPSQHTLFPSRL